MVKCRQTATRLSIVYTVLAASNVARITSPQIASLSFVNYRPSVPYVPQHTRQIVKAIRRKNSSKYLVGNRHHPFQQNTNSQTCQTRSKILSNINDINQDIKFMLDLGINLMLKPLLLETPLDIVATTLSVSQFIFNLNSVIGPLGYNRFNLWNLLNRGFPQTFITIHHEYYFSTYPSLVIIQQYPL